MAQPSGIERDASIPSGPDSAIVRAYDRVGNLTYLIPPSCSDCSGPNLFHSFHVFDVGVGETALFLGPTGTEIDNVIARVTGGSASHIDGTLRSTIPGADLYLLNPAGIFFGAHAKVDVAGAFHASTAESIQFADGSELRARLGGAAPLLTSAPPVAFGFLGTPEARIDLDGTVLQTRGGIELAAGRIELRRGAQIGTGSHRNEPGFRAGDIVLHATDVVRLSGLGAVGSGSLLSASSLGPGTNASAGDISITAGAIELLDGVRIGSEAPTFGTGNGGDISLLADESIEISGVSCYDLGSCFVGFKAGSWINAVVGSTDAIGGNILLDAPRIRIGDGGQISAGTLGSAPGGDITLRATESLTLEGSSDDQLRGSLIHSYTSGLGRAGSIGITAGMITLRDGAVIRSGPDFDPKIPEPVAEGGGGIRLSASVGISLTGVFPLASLQRPTAITASTRGSLDAGDISVTAPWIQVRDGAQIASNTFSTGDSGSIAVTAAEEVVLAGRGGPNRLASAILASGTGGRPDDGDAGAIQISSPRIHLLDGGEIRTEAAHGRVTESGEPEGSISIAASDSLQLDDGSRISASVVEGRGGDVRIASPDAIVLRNGSAILAEATGAGGGTGGRIEIEAGTIIQSPDSRISADAGVGGTDGIVRIDTPEVDLQAGIVPFGLEFLDATSLQRPSCAARGSAEGESRFVVASKHASVRSPEGIELAAWAPPDAPPEPAGESASEREREGDSSARRSDALRSAAVAAQARGRARESIAPLTESLVEAERSRDPGRVRAAVAGLSEAYRGLGEADRASEVIERSAVRAEKRGDAALGATLLDDAATASLSRRELDAALHRLTEAIRVARRAQDRERELLLLSKAARVAAQADQHERAVEWIEQADGLRAALPRTRLASEVLVHLGATHRRLAATARTRRAHQLRSYEALRHASSIAADLGDDRALSYADGNMAELYFEAGHDAEALLLAEAAVRAAERFDAPDSAYRWHHLSARILRSRGRIDEAIESDRRAVTLLDAMRQDVRARDEDAELRFRADVAPVYRHLVDLLLSQDAESAPNAAARLEEARFRMEQLKAAELRNYFRDECAADLQARTRPLGSIGDHVAIVYPILLDDRVELLVNLPSGLRRFRAPDDATRAGVSAQAARLRDALEHGGPERAAAIALHRWLIAPYEGALVAEEITTLVFVPDDVLRKVPIAVLRGERGFVIEQYAVAVTPSLELIDPQPIHHGSVRALLAGASHPQGARPLPFVAEELGVAHALFGGELLLDDAFALDRFEREIRDRRPTLVHIASHGRFTGDPSTSYVLTASGDWLTMEQLRRWVAYSRYRTEPIELLVLSACETAAGDDRAALGLAGSAIAAGARSAMGSLWRIRDDVARDLVTRFYRALAEPGTTKAQALQRAQIAAIREGVAPGEWSPFLLINNWL